MKFHLTRSNSTKTLYHRSLRIWELFFLSLPLEFLLGKYVKALFSPSFALQLAVIATIVIIPFLSSKLLSSTLSRIRANQQLSRVSGNTRAARWILGIITFLLLVKVLALLAETGLAQSNVTLERTQSWIIPIGLGVLFVIGLLYGSLKHLAKEWRDDQNRMQLQDSSQLKKWEEQLLIISSLPMLLARGITFLGSATEELSSYSQVVFWISGSILLLLLRPQQNTFIGSCARCKQPVPVVMTELGGCRSCRAKS